jgi:hypothetical protein
MTRVTFEQALDHLDDWAGRDIAAAVRITSEEGPAPVAVFRGRLGKAERADGEVFLPVRLGRSLDWPLGLRLEQEEFEEARVDARRLYMTLEDAVVEVATA